MYVTDGGHHDNLALVEALRRGASNIIVLDASGDKPDLHAITGSTPPAAIRYGSATSAIAPRNIRHGG